MSFKEQLQKDVASIFLNAEEFAAEEEMGFELEDGTIFTMILPVLTDEAETSHAKKFEPEIGQRREVLWLPTLSLTEAAVTVGSVVVWRGEEWGVEKCRDEDGVTRLELLYR